MGGYGNKGRARGGAPKNQKSSIVTQCWAPSGPQIVGRRAESCTNLRLANFHSFAVTSPLRKAAICNLDLTVVRLRTVERGRLRVE